MACLQTIIGDAGQQMMNMMKADIAREPLQDRWQFEIGTSLKRGAKRGPVWLAHPFGGFKSVLDGKEPYAGYRGGNHYKKLYQENGSPAQERGECR